MGRLVEVRRKALACTLAVLASVVFSAVVGLPRAWGQSDGRMHQYMFNQLDFNPGYAGSQGVMNVYALARQQWLGFGKGAPRTYFVNFDMPFGYRSLSQMSPGHKMEYSHGLGVHLMRDEVGFMSTNGIELSYVGRFHLRATGSLGVGLGVRAVNDRFDATWRTPDGVVEQDAAIPDGKASGIGFDLSFGLYYNTPSMFFGLSAQNLLGAKLRDRLFSKLGKRARLDRARQVYVVSGYHLPLRMRWALEPSLMFRTDFVQYQLGVSLLAEYNSLFWFGASYHVAESAGALLGVNLFNGLRIGYSYDYPLSAISQFTSGSHEVVLGYSFSLSRERLPERYKSIRYL